MKAIHELKTWPQSYVEVLAGRKVHEIRRFDRPYKAGDVLKLREWRPDRVGSMVLGYTGRVLFVEVTYVTFPGQWGLPGPKWTHGRLPEDSELDPGIGVMSIRVIPEDERLLLGLIP